jgi:hypothetical protein
VPGSKGCAVCYDAKELGDFAWLASIFDRRILRRIVRHGSPNQATQ